MICNDCDRQIPAEDAFALLGDNGELDKVCEDCARCVRCRGLPSERFPTVDGSCCAGCLTPAEASRGE